MHIKKFFFLLAVYLFLLPSCHHFSGKLSLSDDEIRRYASTDQSLRRSSGIEYAEQTDVLIYRNWQYSGFWNNLASWKKSQDLFVEVCVSYWKIDPKKITIIEQDKAAKLEYFLKNYKGKRLIIYFVSHQTSKGEIVLHDGSYYPSRRLAHLLNKLPGKTLLVYDTCHAELIMKDIVSTNVSVYCSAKEDEEAYDFRPKGQKPSLSKNCKNTHRFIKGAWNIDVKSASVFGFYLVMAMVDDSYSGITLDSLMKSIINNNRQMKKIVGMGQYSDITWSDPAGWGALKVRQ